MKNYQRIIVIIIIIVGTSFFCIGLAKPEPPAPGHYYKIVTEFHNGVRYDVLMTKPSSMSNAYYPVMMVKR